MPVKIEKELTPEMQAVADARKAEQEAADQVDELKERLKAAKAVWELAVEEMKKAIDEAIYAERQPSLFSDLPRDDGGDLADAGASAPGPDGKPPPRVVDTAAMVFAGNIDDGSLDEPAPKPLALAGPADTEFALTGETLAAVGLFEAELKGKYVGGKIGKRGERAAKLPFILLNDRPHVVIALSDGPAGKWWLLRPLWPQNQFEDRHPSPDPDDIYIGALVELQLKQWHTPRILFVGGRGEERKLILPAEQAQKGKKEKGKKAKPAKKGAKSA